MSIASRYERALGHANPGFREILRNLPPRNDPPPLPPNWLHSEMLERHRVVQEAGIPSGARVLEIGSGAHAIATVALAHAVGPAGRVVALERERWAFFREIVAAAGMAPRVRAVLGDARELPLRDDAFNLAACVHGLRSLRDEATMVSVFREMLRVAPAIILAESLPVARNDAQRAHLAMYNLREEIFEAVLGQKDDLHYPPLERVADLVRMARGRVVATATLEIGLPHFLAFIPRPYVERIEDPALREGLLRRWAEANRALEAHGAEHPPVGLVRAVRNPHAT